MRDLEARIQRLVLAQEAGFAEIGSGRLFGLGNIETERQLLSSAE